MEFQKSISDNRLSSLVAGQLNHLFPDGDIIEAGEVESCLSTTLERVFACFSRIKIKYYRTESSVIFNHLHSDQYCAFLYLLGNTAYANGNIRLATKTFLLNKALHGLDLYYSVQLPEVFLLVHPVGSVIGNAKYGNFFTAYQNCTIGSTIKNGNYIYPQIGEYVTLFAKSSLIGDVNIGRHSVIGANTFVINSIIPEKTIVTGSFPDLKLQENKNTESPFYL